MARGLRFNVFASRGVFDAGFPSVFLFVHDVFGSLALFLQSLGGIDFLRVVRGEGPFDGRDEAPDQQTGHHGTDHENQYSFRIFHHKDSIKVKQAPRQW